MFTIETREREDAHLDSLRSRKKRKRSPLKRIDHTTHVARLRPVLAQKGQLSDRGI